MRPIPLGLLVLFCAAVPVADAQTVTTLSRLVPGASLVTDTAVMRQQRIEVPDLSVISDAPGSAMLRLNLFSDIVIDARRQYAEPTSSGMSWVGRLEGYPTSTVVLVTVGDQLAGHIYAPFGFFRIEPDASGAYVVQQVDTSQEPIGTDAIPAPSDDDVRPRQGAIGVRADDGSVIDLLVVYTQEALAGYGGADRAQVAIDLVVAETNQALRATGVRARIRLIHATSIEYAETGDSHRELDRLRLPSDGFLDRVHALRDAYAADLVALITNRASSNVCGIAYLGSPNSPATWAFSITHRDCTRNGRTFAHELGHNLGADHDWYTASGGAYAYSKGYVSLPGRFLDVMAYYTLCNDTGTSCDAILAYSSPARSHNGRRTGVSPGTSTACSVGNRGNPDCDADVGRTIDEMAPTVARFRDSRLSITARQLLPGASFRSDNGQYRLLLQVDGNLVLYDDRARSSVWATNTVGIRPREVILQSDGNWVLYDINGCPRWASGTGGNTNAYLLVQDDGNVVIYRSNGQPAWSRHEQGQLLSC